MDAEEVTGGRPGRGYRLRGSEAMLGQERDLVRDSADDVGAGQYPDTMSDGIRQTVAETLAQLAGPAANLGVGGVAAVQDGAERWRPGTGADAECLELRMAKCRAMLNRVGPDPRQPRIREIAVHRDPRPGSVGRVDRAAQCFEVVGG